MRRALAAGTRRGKALATHVCASLSLGASPARGSRRRGPAEGEGGGLCDAPAERQGRAVDGGRPVWTERPREPRLGAGKSGGRALTHLGSATASRALPLLLRAALRDPLGSAGSATGLIGPASPPAAASLPRAPSGTLAPGGEESDGERRRRGLEEAGAE